MISEESAAIEVERWLRSLARSSATLAVRVELHPAVAAMLAAGRPSRLQRLEMEAGRRFIVQTADESVPLDHAAIVPD